MTSRRTGSNHDVCPSELSALFPQPGSSNLALGTLKEADERVDGCPELGFAGGLCGGVLCLEITVKGGYEDAVDVVGLEAYKGAGVYVMVNPIGCMWIECTDMDQRWAARGFVWSTWMQGYEDVSMYIHTLGRWIPTLQDTP